MKIETGKQHYVPVSKTVCRLTLPMQHLSQLHRPCIPVVDDGGAGTCGAVNRCAKSPFVVYMEHSAYVLTTLDDQPCSDNLHLVNTSLSYTILCAFMLGRQAGKTTGCPFLLRVVSLYCETGICVKRSVQHEK